MLSVQIAPNPHYTRARPAKRVFCGNTSFEDNRNVNFGNNNTIGPEQPESSAAQLPQTATETGKPPAPRALCLRLFA